MCGIHCAIFVRMKNTSLKCTKPRITDQHNFSHYWKHPTTAISSEDSYSPFHNFVYPGWLHLLQEYVFSVFLLHQLSYFTSLLYQLIHFRLIRIFSVLQCTIFTRIICFLLTFCLQLFRCLFQ